MPQIEFSSGLMTGLPARILRIGDYISTATADPNTCGILGFGNNNTNNVKVNGTIYIMKGTPPDATSWPTLFSQRSADVLVSFTDFNASGATTPLGVISTPSNQTTNPALVATIYQTATATGVASWFWVVARATTNGSTSYTDTIIHQFRGTIGTTGSGADLEIPSTNIISGVDYRIRGLALQFPSLWTY